MKRIMSFLLTCISVLTMLSGCGGKGGAGEKKESEFMVSKISDEKIYKITNLYTDRVLDGENFGYIEGSKARQKRYNGDLNQFWGMTVDKNKNVKIKNLTTGYVLSVKEDSEEDGAAIVLQEESKSSYQTWKLKEKGSGWLIESVPSEKAIGIPNDSRTDAVALELNAGSDEKSRVWKIEQVTATVKTLPKLLALTGSISHSATPEIVKFKDMYYSYNMSPGIGIKQSKDLKNWSYIKQTTAFEQKSQPFEWMEEAVPDGDIWAPGVYRFGGKNYLYYCVSKSGQVSAIGVGVNKTLDPTSPDFKWEDLGMVISSKEGDKYNCIDPNIILDEDDEPWLVFGSWWDGIFLRKINKDTGMLSDEDTTFYPLASQKAKKSGIEAPYMVKHDDYYYLFAAFGNTQENYHSSVGRSKSIKGPFVDRDGVDMLDGGGSMVTYSKDSITGPGHASVFIDDDGQYYLVSEYFREGVPTQMLITTIEWDEDGWPVTALTPNIIKESE